MHSTSQFEILFAHIMQRAVHQRLKPHICRSPHCEKRFAKRWNRKKHENRAHELVIDSLEQVRKNSRSCRSASYSAPQSAPAATFTNLIHPTSAMKAAGPPSAPRPRRRTSPNTIEPVTPRTFLLTSSHTRSRSRDSPPVEPVAPHTFCPLPRSRADAGTAKNVLELKESSGFHRGVRSGSDTQNGGTGGVAAQLFKSVSRELPKS